MLRYASQQNIISQQIRTLTKMQSEHASDPQAVARYQANIAALQQQLKSLQLTDSKGRYLIRSTPSTSISPTCTRPAARSM